MTKPASKSCSCCEYFDNAVPCQKGHRPRYYMDGRGYCRVCKDFKLDTNPISFLDRLKALFGIS